MKHMSVSTSLRILSLAAVVTLVTACRGEQQPAGNAASGAQAPSAPAAAGPVTPGPGGKIIEVTMVTDGEGNYFKPAEVHANRGDVVRFVLKVGVHNVNFLPDSNAGKPGFPQAPSEFLQLPGQTYDIAVGMPAGDYYFQCDPHAALGMKGRLIVH
jgi:plastocyanin